MEDKVSNAIVNSNYIVNYGSNIKIIDKWFIGKNAKEKIQEEIFSHVLGHEYKVEVIADKIILNEKEQPAYHLIVSTIGYNYSYPYITYATNTGTPVINPYEITCASSGNA